MARLTKEELAIIYLSVHSSMADKLIGHHRALEAELDQKVAEAVLADGPTLAKVLFELDNQEGDAPWPIDWDRQPCCRWAIRDAIKILDRIAANRVKVKGGQDAK